MQVGARRVLVFGAGSRTSGIPAAWAASNRGGGVAMLRDLSVRSADAFAARVARVKRSGDVAIASIHWGSNWGHAVPDAFTTFAHRLIDAGVDLVHGHSSHHARAIERYRDKLVLYGCGDLIHDYEGISGHDAYRGDLVLMYFARLDARTGHLLSLRMRPFRVCHLQLTAATRPEAEWLAGTIASVAMAYGTRVALGEDLEIRVE